jgi:hypothetical protein
VCVCVCVFVCGLCVCIVVCARVRVCDEKGLPEAVLAVRVEGAHFRFGEGVSDVLREGRKVVGAWSRLDHLFLLLHSARSAHPHTNAEAKR